MKSYNHTMSLHKVRVDATIKPELVEWLDREIGQDRFANRSQAIDYCIEAAMVLEDGDALELLGKQIGDMMKNIVERYEKIISKLHDEVDKAHEGHLNASENLFDVMRLCAYYQNENERLKLEAAR